MMSRILGIHPDIFAFNELQFFEHVVPPEQISRNVTVSHDIAVEMAEKLFYAQRDGVFSKLESGKYQAECVAVIGETVAPISPVEVFERFCSRYAKQEGKDIACEQTPKNLYYAKGLLEAIPTAVFINMVRDPRDVMLSQKKRWRRRFLGAKKVPWVRETIRSYMNYHPVAMAELWKSSVQTAKKLESSRFLIVRYESLLRKPEEELRRICNFIGVPYDEKMLDIERVGSSNAKDSKGARGIDSSRSGHWRSGLSRSEVHICQRIAGREMRELGYKEVDAKIPRVLWGWFWITFIIKMGIALILNLGRTKNLYQSFKRRFVLR